VLRTIVAWIVRGVAYVFCIEPPWRSAMEQRAKEKQWLDLSERCPMCGKPWPWGHSKMDTHFALRCPNCDALFENDRFVCFGVPKGRARLMGE
jgi:hypothetical protein